MRKTLTYKQKRLSELQIVRTAAEPETPILWAPDVTHKKDPAAGKDWGQKEKEVRENEMIGWRHQLNGHEFEQTPGDSEGKGSLECCNPWGSQVDGHDLVTEPQKKCQRTLPMHISLCTYAHSHVVESKEKENLEGSHRKREIVYERKGIMNKFGQFRAFFKNYLSFSHSKVFPFISIFPVFYLVS